MLIQVILVIGVIAVGIFFTRPTGSDSHLALRRIFLGLFVVAAAASIIFPTILTQVAHLVGVGRGADLLLYLLVLAFLVFVSTSYRRSVGVNRRITQLARQITLAEARLEDAKLDADQEDRSSD